MFGQSNGEFHEELGKLLMIISSSHSPAVWHLKFCHNLYVYTFLIANADLSKYCFFGGQFEVGLHYVIDVFYTNAVKHKPLTVDM